MNGPLDDPKPDAVAPRGLARVPQACRDYLREALGGPSGAGPGASNEGTGHTGTGSTGTGHIGTGHTGTGHTAGCAFCAQRREAALRLSPALRARPTVPANVALGSRTLLDGIYERAIELAEESPLGRLVGDAVAEVPAPDAAAAGAVWAEPLLESGLARATMVPPPALGAAAWREVRTSIFDRVVAEAATRRRYWPLGAAGAAAAAILLTLLLHEGRPRATDIAPDIVFADLNTAPNVDFAILRYGPNR